jgi:hypothetical protein
MPAPDTNSSDFFRGNPISPRRLNEALRKRLHRFEPIAVLEEMNREDSPSEAGELAGKVLWQKIRPSPRE